MARVRSGSIPRVVVVSAKQRQKPTTRGRQVEKNEEVEGGFFKKKKFLFIYLFFQGVEKIDLLRFSKKWMRDGNREGGGGVVVFFFFFLVLSSL